MTLSLISFVCNQGVFLSPKKQGSFKSVSSEVSRVFQGRFKNVSRVFHKSFKSVSTEFRGVSRNFQGGFENV